MVCKCTLKIGARSFVVRGLFSLGPLSKYKQSLFSLCIPLKNTEDLKNYRHSELYYDGRRSKGILRERAIASAYTNCVLLLPLKSTKRNEIPTSMLLVVDSNLQKPSFNWQPIESRLLRINHELLGHHDNFGNCLQLAVRCYRTYKHSK